MSNGSATPPTTEHPPPPHSITNGISADAAKFVFPQSAIPISPGIFSSPTFFSACATSGVTPMTPTLLTPAGPIEPYLRAPGQVYSPFTLAPPIPGSLPKTPTLPPPSPHTIVGGAFPLTSQGLPTSANLANSPFGKGSNFIDEIAKFGSIPVSPFTIMSPGGGAGGGGGAGSGIGNSSPKKANGTATVFFPTTITANGDAKLTTLVNGISFNQDHHVDGMGLDNHTRGQGTNSPIVKIEANGHPSCCVGEEV